MTWLEFANKYSGNDLEALAERGQFPVPYNCDYKGCHGWAMVSAGTVYDHVMLHTPDETNPN